MIWILSCIGILCLVIGWLVWMTPYPFVWMLRRQKDSTREKGPDGIVEIRASLNVEKGLPYPSKYPKATYDIYIDPNQEVKRFLIWVHGGSFIGGTSEGAKNFAALHANTGTLVCAINYAWAPEYAFPTQLLQLDEFLNYAETTILPAYTSKKVPCFIGGDSAGANISASYACARTKANLAKEMNLTIQAKTPIQGLILCCGPYDFCEDYRKEEWGQFRKFFRYIGWAYLGKKNWFDTNLPNLASPMHHITSDFPATYLCDGKLVSFLWQGVRFAEVLKEHKVEVTTRFYDTMGHGFQFDYVKNKVEASQVYEDTLTFLNEHS